MHKFDIYKQEGIDKFVAFYFTEDVEKMSLLSFNQIEKEITEVLDSKQLNGYNN